MDETRTELIAVFDIGRSWKRFRLYDRNLNALHTEERIIGEIIDGEGRPADDLDAIEAWMQSCLSAVVSRNLNMIRGVSISAADDILSHLGGALTMMIRNLPGNAGQCRSYGISSTTASLIPYLQGSDKPFIMVSTGTWCTFMNPFDREPFTGEQHGEGETGFMTVGGQQVKYSRFRLGGIHDINVTILDDHFGVTGELYKTIKIKSRKIEKIQTNRKGRVFFRHGIPPDFADYDADLKHFLTYADAYHQMMYDLVDECLRSYRDVVSEGDSTEIIYVTGGFARNDTFVRILATRIPDKRVFASTIEDATSIGAAMNIYRDIFECDLPPVYLGLKAITPND